MRALHLPTYPASLPRPSASACCPLQILAVLAYRQFGWRLYSKLGVDFREKGAAGRCAGAAGPA